MKKIIYTLMFLFYIINICAQNTSSIDTLKYKCKYLITYQPDSTDLNSIDSEEMLLLIGSKKSKFLSLGTFLRDSLLNNIDKDNINSLSLMTLYKSAPKTNFKEKVFKNLRDNKITVTEQVLKNDYRYEEPLKGFKWVLKDSSKIISGYHCQKATTNYGGRDYIAWFTNEIPVSEGPYKFNGLPGLIIQISDTKKHYTYKLVGFEEQIIPNAIILKPKNYIKTTKKELYEFKKEFYGNVFKKLEQSGISLNFDHPSQKKDVLNTYKKRNNPIELDNEVVQE